MFQSVIKASAVFAVFALCVSNTWAGGIIYVPMSWCIVDQSPAEASPNINGDTNTDALIWRRHERPTDNIYTPQAGISLRSTINDIWGSWSFPIIEDPDQTTVCGAFECVTESDIRGEDVNDSAINGEFNDLISACRTAYANIGKAGIGITAVNLGLYHEDDPEYIGIIGWGGCAKSGGSSDCAIPYDGLIAVIDNKYLYPTSPNRTWPGNNDKTGWAFTLTDPLDQLVAHEVGHALSLPHRNNTSALMFPSSQDNNSDGMTDNITLNATEIAALQANALNVPGVEIDPPGVFDPGRFNAMFQPALVPRNQKLPRDMNIAGVRATWDKEKGVGTLEANLHGMLTPNSFFDVWYLVDQDNNPETGAQEEDLKKLGVPGNPTIKGVEAAAMVTVRSGELFPTGWQWRNGFEEVRVLAELLSMTLHAHVAPFARKSDEVIQPKLPRDAQLYNIVRINFGAIPDKPFAFQMMTAANNEVVDMLNPREPAVLELVDPVFPHCFAAGDGEVGGAVKVEFDGLNSFAGKPYHALLGPNLVANGFIDANGGGVVEIPIAVGTAEGPHLVTIGPDGAALTADCTINVVDPLACDGDFDGDGDVDGTDLGKFSKNFGRTDCRIPQR